MNGKTKGLTEEQKAAALEAAKIARRRRARLLEGVRKGEIEVSAFMEFDDKIAKRTRVDTLLRAVPGIGPVKAVAIMDEIGINENRRVGGLGKRQREKLMERLA